MERLNGISVSGFDFNDLRSISIYQKHIEKKVSFESVKMSKNVEEADSEKTPREKFLEGIVENTVSNISKFIEKISKKYLEKHGDNAENRKAFGELAIKSVKKGYDDAMKKLGKISDELEALNKDVLSKVNDFINNRWLSSEEEVKVPNSKSDASLLSYKAYNMNYTKDLLNIEIEDVNGNKLQLFAMREYKEETYFNIDYLS